MSTRQSGSRISKVMRHARRRRGLAARTSSTTEYWSTSTTFPQDAKLAGDADTDVLVVGGGMTGLSAAYLLAKAGKRVIVLGDVISGPAEAPLPEAD